MSTLGEVMGSIDMAARDALVLRVEDALAGYEPPEAFIVLAYFTALSIARLPCGDSADLIDDMPRILRSVIANELATVTRQ